MPRFVRPAWIEVAADGGTERGTGPRTRDGYLSARLTLRTADATVSDTIRILAGGSFRDGSGRVSIDIPRGMAVQVESADGTVTVYPAGSIRALEVRPVAS